MQVCPNCQMETALVPPAFLCTHCKAELLQDKTFLVTTDADKTQLQTLNQVIVPDVVAGDAPIQQRESIKHKIKLTKTPLPEDRLKETHPKVQTQTPVDLPSQDPFLPVAIFTPNVTPTPVNPIVEVNTVHTPIPPSTSDALSIQSIMAEFEAKNQALEETLREPIVEEKTVLETPSLPEIQPEVTVLEPNANALLKEALEKEAEEKRMLEELLKEKPHFPEIQPDVTVLESHANSLLKEALEKEAEEKRMLEELLKEKPVENAPITPNEEAIPLEESDPFLREALFNIKKEEEKLLAFLHDQPQDADSVPDIRKIENKVADKQGKEVLAWLIRHTEGMEPIYYELFEGDNTFGRTDARHPVDIEITDDKHVSRGHAFIRIMCVPPRIYLYELYDDGSKRADNSPSLNGTYLNGKTERIKRNNPVYLQDGDTIQVGLTKLVFKIKPSPQVDIEDISTQIITSDYTRTVMFKG